VVYCDMHYLWMNNAKPYVLCIYVKIVSSFESCERIE